MDEAHSGQAEEVVVAARGLGQRYEEGSSWSWLSRGAATLGGSQRGCCHVQGSYEVGSRLCWQGGPAAPESGRPSMRGV